MSDGLFTPEQRATFEQDGASRLELVLEVLDGASLMVALGVLGSALEIVASKISPDHPQNYVRLAMRAWIEAAAYRLLGDTITWDDEP